MVSGQRVGCVLQTEFVASCFEKLSDGEARSKQGTF
jgi:hypothetical protein